MSRPNSVEAEKLARSTARALGGEYTVDGVRRLSGGASRETWAFDAHSTVDGVATTEQLVLRRDPGASSGQIGRSTEFLLLDAVGRAGAPVPLVRFLLEADDGLGDGFVMERIEGETIARRILRDDEYAEARPLLAAQCGEIAARIHAIDTAGLPSLDVLGPHEQIAQYRSLVEAFGEAHPAFELAFRWLETHAPEAPSGGPRLVHGDYRNGNFIVGPEGIRSVLDWELSHLGDPAEDFGWLCVRSWRFGVNDKLVGGFGDLEDLLTAYNAAGGTGVDAERVRYWEIFGTLKWGVICQMQCASHVHGIVRSVENAMLGRRVAETEWDLLNLITGDDPGPDPTWSLPALAANSSSLTIHDSPSAQLLVEAVREFLEKDVMPNTEGRISFHARVASNALRMVERELGIGHDVNEHARTQLATLLGVDAPLADLLQALAASIRNGADHDAPTITAVRELVRAKLLVSDPTYTDPT